MKRFFAIIASFLVSFSAIGIAYAATNSVAAAALAGCVPGRIGNFHDLVFNLFIGCILSPAVYLIIGIAVVVFLYGIVKFIMSDGEGREEGKQFMFYGIVGLFIIVSLWAFVRILQSTFNLNSTDLNIRPTTAIGQ